MKNLKTLREQLKITQKELADRFETTQQTIARWENGKSEPSIAQMRDMAMLFGVSVDYLIGKKSAQKETCLPFIGDFFDGEVAGYWGNIGLKPEGQEMSKWYPISTREYDRVNSWLNNCEDDQSLLIITTMNNRLLFLRPGAMDGISLLDEACDGVRDDWDVQRDDIEGAPLELYHAMNDRLHGNAGDPENPTTSQDLNDQVDELLGKWGLDNEDALSDFLETTKITMTSGAVTKLDIEAECISYLHMHDSSEPPKMIRLDDELQGVGMYVPWRKIAMIDTPLIPALNQYERELEEY